MKKLLERFMKNNYERQIKQIIEMKKARKKTWPMVWKKERL